MYIDLRPPHVNRRLERRRLLRLCGWTWSVAVLIGLASLGFQYHSLQAKASFAASRLANARTLQAVERRIETLQAELADDEVRLTKIRGLIPQDRSLTAIAILADSVRASGGRVVVTAVDFSDQLEITPGSKSTGAAGGDGPQERQSSSMAIAEFVQTLECQGFFSGLKLTAAQTVPLPGGPAKEFDVECEW